MVSVGGNGGFGAKNGIVGAPSAFSKPALNLVGWHSNAVQT